MAPETSVQVLPWYFHKDRCTVNGVQLLKTGRQGGKQAIALDSLEEMVVTGKGTETDFRHHLE